MYKTDANDASEWYVRQRTRAVSTYINAVPKEMGLPFFAYENDLIWDFWRLVGSIATSIVFFSKVKNYTSFLNLENYTAVS